MTLSKLYPALRQFFGYFGQDLDMEIPAGGDWRDIVDLFLADEPPEYVDAVIIELDRFLASYDTDQAISQATGTLGNYYLPSIAAREWVIALRSRLSAAAETRGTGSF